MPRNLRGLQGIWFLAADRSTGTWELLPVMVGSVLVEMAILPALADMPTRWAQPGAADPPERILRELAAVLDAGAGKGNPFVPEFLAQVSDSTSGLTDLYRLMLASPGVDLSSAGLARLLRNGDVPALSLLAEKANLPNHEFLKRDLVVQAVCEYYNGNVTGIGLLGRLAQAAGAPPRLRRCAAHSLRTIHSRETVPSLLTLLDADDQSVRYEAVAGLASYANSGFIVKEKPLVIDGVVHARQGKPERDPETADRFPTFDRFLKEEAGTIAFWRQWATRLLAAPR